MMHGPQREATTMTPDPKAMLGAAVRGEFQPPADSGVPTRPIDLRLVRHVGAGKFAWVFEAQDAAGGRFAVKMLYRDDVQATRRFKREIKVLRQLPAHPNRVAYRGHGVHGTFPWVAMDFVDGFTLGAILRQNRPVPEQAACALMVQLCDGFDGLHKLGLTHRDITPDNIMITNAERSVKLMDFGLVQDSQGLLQLYEQVDILQGDDFLDDLDAGLIAGTPEFMAPEQISDPHEKDRARQKTDTTADVFALGTIFYQLLAGQQLFPFGIGSRGAAGKQGLINYLDYRMNFRDEHLVAPGDATPELWSIVRKSLLRDPKHRQRDGAELGADIRFYLETGQGVLEDDMSATIAQDIDLAKLRALATNPMTTGNFNALKGSLGTGEPAYATADTVREAPVQTIVEAAGKLPPRRPLTVQDRTTEVGRRAAPSSDRVREAQGAPTVPTRPKPTSRNAIWVVLGVVVVAAGVVVGLLLK
jgi:serine/threonine-protein kinase